MNMSNPESAFAKVEYQLVNNTVKDLLVKKNGGFNYIIPGLVKPTNYSTLVLVVKMELPDDQTIFIDPSVVTNPLDKEIVTLLEDRLRAIKAGTPFKPNGFPVSATINITLGENHASGPNNEIISEMFGFTLALDLTSFNKFVGNNVESGLDVVEQEILDVVKEANVAFPLVTGILLVDQHSINPPLWIHQLGEGERIPTLRDGSKPDGLYYTIGRRHSNVIKERIPLNDLTENKLKELGIFTDQRTAAVGGNSKLLQQLQSSVEDSSKNNRRLKTSLEDSTKVTESLNLKIEELKTQLNIMKNKFDLMKTKGDITKAKSDSNFFLDFIKTLGSLASVFFTGYKLFSS